MTVTVIRLLFLLVGILSLTVPTRGEVIRSTAKEQKRLHLTVYSGGFALVSDQRELRLLPGRQQVQFMDIAASMQPESVIVQGEGIRLLEQTFAYDLLTPQKLLEKYLGKEVTLVFRERKGNETVWRRETATLLSTAEGTVWQIGDRIVTNPPTATMEFPRLPPELLPRPTLLWEVESEGGSRVITVSYLAGQLTWKADYVFTLSTEGTSGDLTGWVTLENRSGTAYQQATLQLIAGEVRRVQEEQRVRRGRPMMEMAKAAAPAQFTEQPFAEYHLYTFPRPVTIKHNQTKQLPLLTGKGSKVKRVYRLLSQRWYYESRQPTLPPPRVQTAIKVQNSKENGLGIPLPAGIVRVYQIDAAGERQFIGEDRIPHTPRDEEMTLVLGTAFDVTAERRQTAYRVLGDRLYESSHEILLRNHKAEAITVAVQEHFGGDWEILSPSHPYKKTDAFTATFDVPVPAGGQAVLTYTVRVRYR